MLGTTKRPVGRPPKDAAERKRNNLTMRLRDVMKGRLKLAAIENGRSLSEEIESRVERSFADDRTQTMLQQILDRLEERQ